jgi:hypothetical protein
MRHWTRWLAAALIASGMFTSGALMAQRRLLEPEYRMLSGSDVGFRLESRDLSGRALGRWMVRIDGQWVEAMDAPTARHATQ